MQRIKSILALYPKGLGIAEIESALQQQHKLKLNRRTLQRRLQKLIENGSVITQGESITLVYLLITSSSSHAANAELYVSLSVAGASIRDQVRIPLMHRQPVAYQHEFLERYQPGKTFYLPGSLRSQLHEMGRTAMNERPAGTYARDILGRLLVDLAWASSKLEGNTYSRLDTQNLIEHGQIAQGKAISETQMILNHKAAIEMLVEDINEISFDAFTWRSQI